MLSRDTLVKCGSTILKILTTTKLDDQDKVVEIAKIMSESSKLSDGEQSADIAENYEISYRLLKKVSRLDFLRIVEIAREEN